MEKFFDHFFFSFFHFISIRRIAPRESSRVSQTLSHRRPTPTRQNQLTRNPPYRIIRRNTTQFCLYAAKRPPSSSEISSRNHRETFLVTLVNVFGEQEGGKGKIILGLPSPKAFSVAPNASPETGAAFLRPKIHISIPQSDSEVLNELLALQ